MDCNRDEALRARTIAEQRYASKDLAGAKKFLLKAMQLHPALEGAQQLLAVVEVELVTQRKVTPTDYDWYGILQVDQGADDATVKKQYRKLALALHPDKNKLPGAEAAFKLVGEANGVLADRTRRQQFDIKKATLQPHTASNGCHGTAPGANGSSSDNDAFWTSCPTCRTGFQYKREFLNIRVQCQKCSAFFTTKEEAAQNYFPWGQPGAYADRPIPNGFTGGMNFPNFAHRATANAPNASSYRFCKPSVTVTTPNVNATGAGSNKEAPRTAAKSAEVVQQTFEKVKRDRVEAERESKRKDKERMKESRRKSKEEQEKVQPKVTPKTSCNAHEPTPMQVDDAVKEPAGKVEPEKKVGKSRKRSRRKHSSSDEEELEPANGWQTEGNHDDAKDDKFAVGKGGDGPVSGLRRSQRAKNPHVAYVFGDSEEEEDDDLVDFLVSKKPCLPQETPVVTNKSVGVAVQDLKSNPGAVNGNADARADNVQQQPDGTAGAEVKDTLEQTSRKGHSFQDLTKSKLSEGLSKVEGGSKGDRMWQGHCTKLADRESCEVELQEYLQKGDKKERGVVNVINNEEIRESMKGKQVGEQPPSKSIDKGKKVVASGVPETGEERLQTGNLQSKQTRNVSPFSAGSGRGQSPAEEVVTGNKGSKSRSVPAKSKSPSVSGTYNRSAAVKEKQEDIRSGFAGRFLKRSSANVTPPKRPARTAATRRRPSPTASSCCAGYTRSDDSGDIVVPDTNFHQFDNDRGERDIGVGQIWAIYDDIDGMPRFYGKIVKVEQSPFKADLQWLEAQISKRSQEWLESTTLAISCGEFKLGSRTVANQVNIFSHKMSAGKGLKNVMRIYPRKHDVWALYKDWDKKWPHPKKDGTKNTQYEMVEVMSDYCEETGVDVAPLAKVEGFTAIFKRQVGVVDSYPRRDDLLRFSHRVPAAKMTGNEALRVPKDSWELDTASMPLYLISPAV